MDYIITFFQGLISFVSPCMIPMLPIYISYFAGNRNKKSSTLMRALFFVLGFTFVFSVLGMFAGALGSFFVHYETQLHMVCGAIIVLLGLNFMGVIKIPFIKGLHAEQEVTGIFTSFLFGIVFSMSHIPCIMAFLGSALTLAAHAGTACKGILLLVVYSLGMGIPFLVSALIIDKLSNLLDIVRKNHKKIDLISGILLIVLGVLMMTGILHHLMGHTHVH
ncbi:MAG: sulfite exporter TauE/SafE family protein [Clostridia bacterium]|nr:sulfite exporter TauE/SafE family protein [Clostridia bacterium]